MSFPIEINPFSLNQAFSDPIQSISLSSNIDWFDTPTDPYTGQSVILQLNAKTNIAPFQVYATGASTGEPLMISLLQGHIPNIEISQVNGLQSAINSLVKSLASANNFLTVSNNGVGAYTLTVNTGTTSSTVAIGNDTRFPAGVTGLRKSSGAGSTDVAAVAKVDYWDTSVAVASGASHAKGLVPDPGVTAGTTKFLREDMTFVAPAGTGTVTSVALTVPAEFSVAGSPITTNGTLAVTKATQTANTIFAGPTSGGAVAPTFRAQVYADVSPIVGTISSTIAAGNDSRFPASVTGLRKSTGLASTDIAAVAKTDYWDTTVFVGVGPSHAIGLVPDPGAGTLTGRYLREDNSWQIFVPAASSITNAMLATMAAATLKGNASFPPITGTPTDVNGQTARSKLLLNLESITTFGDTNYTSTNLDNYVQTSATLTASRTITLPLSSTMNPGEEWTFMDDFGAINGANVINISRQGSDTIQGSSAALLMDIPKGGFTLTADGFTKWSVKRRVPSVRRTIFVSSTTYNTPTGVKALYVEGVADGGGGGGALGAASNCGVGSGGGAGGYGNVLITNPSSSYVVTIGPGGLGGVGNASGSTGTGTSFGSALVCSPGNGGGSMASGTALQFQDGGAGQYIGAGDFGAAGSDGGAAIRLSGTIAKSGDGAAASQNSGFTKGRTTQGDGSGGGGTRHFGGGGAGALSFNTTSQTGGQGVQGYIIVTEYY
jgi:hypothetical protein